MILLNSNAQNIFWLGRYLTRTQYLCAVFPFMDDTAAREYADAFCLGVENAEQLNHLVLDHHHAASFFQQFSYAKSNVNDLRGVLSAKAYAEMNHQIQTANENVGLICDVVNDCQDILEAESSDIFMFFSLGQCVEQLDRQIRLQQDETATIQHIDYLVAELITLGWSGLEKSWAQLKVLSDQLNFYQFSDCIQQLFEVDA